MNIKYKAFLITIAGLFGLFVTLFTLAQFPVLLFFIFAGGTIYLIYRAVLNYLEHEERFKK